MLWVLTIYYCIPSSLNRAILNSIAMKMFEIYKGTFFYNKRYSKSTLTKPSSIFYTNWMFGYTCLRYVLMRSCTSIWLLYNKIELNKASSDPPGDSEITQEDENKRKLFSFYILNYKFSQYCWKLYTCIFVEL